MYWAKAGAGVVAARALRVAAFSRRIRRHALVRRALACAIVALTVTGAMTVASMPERASAATGETFVVYGDSLTCQEKPHLVQRLQALMPYDNIVVRCQGGTAQCDWHDQMITDLQTLNVRGAMIAFSGNYLTPCITSRDYVQGYADDVNWAADVYSFTGVPMLFVATMGPLNTTAQNNTIPNVYAWVGTSRGFLVIRNEKFFADSSDVYRLMMPCLAGECTDSIQVRTSSTNGHLCVNSDCNQYSSGVVRYAENEIHGVASIKRLAQPPYRSMVTPTPPGALTGVGQTSATTSSVTVGFTPPAGTVRGYRYSTDAGATWCDFTGPPLTMTKLTNASCTGAALVPNSGYGVLIRAFNNAGTGPSVSVSATTAPGAPSALSQTTATGGSVTVGFTPPSGTATINNYQFSTDNGTTWCPLTPADGTSPVTIANLSNAGCNGTPLASNTTYQVKLKAVNAGGVSAASVAIGALTGPAPPTSLTETGATSTSVTVAFTAPSGLLTNMQYSTDDGATWCSRSAASASSPMTITTESNIGCNGPPLGTNAGYALRLRAITATATGTASAPLSIATTAGAPTALSQVGSSGTSVAIGFTPAAGTATITNYQFSTDAGTTWCPLAPADATSPITVSSASAGTCPGAALEPSTAYSVTLRAVNAAGAGTASDAVSAMTGVPAPTALSQIEAANSTVTIAFTPPAASATITDYEYSTDDGATWCPTDPVLGPAAVTLGTISNADCSGGPLTANTTYPTRLRAVTSDGLTGSASSALAAATRAGPPSAVTETGASASSVTLAFTAPSGSVPITNYEFSTDDGTSWCALAPVDGTSPVTVANVSNVGCTGSALASNVGYPVRLRAVTSVGTGASSDRVDAATLAGAPTALSRVDATGSTLTIGFTAPAGSATVTNYRYSTDNGTTWCPLDPANATSPVTIVKVSSATCAATALAPNTTYQVRLRAVNAGGAGAASTALAATTNASMPSALGQVSATTGSVTVNFTAPLGSISNYQYSTDNGASWCALSPVDNASPVVVSTVSNAGCNGGALSSNTAYALRLRAVTASGTGTMSAPFNAVTLAGGITDVAQTGATTGSLTLSFTAPSGNATVSGYQYSTDNGTTWCAISPVTGQSAVVITRVSSKNCTGATLVSRATYSVRLRATNAAGIGVASAALASSTTPGAPTTLTLASRTNASATISFTAPSGSTAITNYQFSTDNGITWCPLNPLDGTSPVTVTVVSNGLCNGAGLARNTSYQIRLKTVTGPNSWNVSAASVALAVTTLA